MKLMEDLHAVTEEYGIYPIIFYEKLTKGKSADVYVLHTADHQKYILKTMESTGKAIFEYEILSHIGKRTANIVGEILFTKDKEPYIQINNTIYQLQVYIPSVISDPPLTEVMASYGQLIEGMKEFETNYISPDRFSLNRLWQKNGARLKEKDNDLFDECRIEIENLIRLDNRKDGWIHGDLGKWNMLMNENRYVYFIDFSESRMGPEYFDLAAIFTSYLPEDPKEIGPYTNLFLTAYRIEKLDDFKQTITLWYVKGMLALAGLDNKNAAKGILYFQEKMKHCGKAIDHFHGVMPDRN